MSGFVTDYEGTSLPGANVVAIHMPTGTRYGTSVRPDGNFNIPNMKSGGPYVVTVSFVGYKEEKLEGVQLGLGQNVTLKFKLIDETKQIDEVVITASRDKIFNADKTGATTNIGTQQLSQLPTLNRSLNDFTRLTPQSNGSSFGGRDNRFNNLTIDGAVNNDVFGLTGTPGGQTNTQPISLDAIQEIQVSLAPYDVRQGSFTGAGINAVTRSGTNELSGSASFISLQWQWPRRCREQRRS
ncbi:MAG: carboxypeptidase-like regulatory domain-containing protein [Cyclobacteriaceae bacterium]|nr:carboxypeptidase-like regulatory domain-containing protein [Cyclobacteriaceae bacterium]